MLQEGSAPQGQHWLLVAQILPLRAKPYKESINKKTTGLLHLIVYSFTLILFMRIILTVADLLLF